MKLCTGMLKTYKMQHTPSSGLKNKKFQLQRLNYLSLTGLNL